MADPEELLFFDTFAHENSEELNLDLVQFPKPVYVTEVRIIPLGARVQADFPGGVRLGATNPSQFQIEFFVNDLGKPGASTFESLGGFEYIQNGCINLECLPNETVRKIPTDGLVLRGWYTTITLAVYGKLTTNIAEQIIQPVVNPTIPAQPNTIQDVQQISSIENEWPQETIPPVPIEYSQQPATPYPQTYVPQEQYTQDYGEYYNEVPKDPRSYHHTPETDWETKSSGRSIERDRDGDRDRDRDRGRDAGYQKSDNTDRDHRTENDRRDRDRDRRYSRSHSRDRERASRDYREGGRDREHDREWDDRHEYRERVDKDWDRDRERERDRDSRYKHQDYKRFGREDREETRKRPRTPPLQSPKRPHTPHSERKDLSPPEVDNLSEEEVNVERQKREKETTEVAPTKSKTPPKDTKETVVVEEPPAPMDVEEFEPILSDEDILDDNDHYQEVDFDYTAYTNNDDLLKLFAPGSTELQVYEKKPLYEILSNKIEITEDLKVAIGISDDFFKSSITKFAVSTFEQMNTEIKEEFIHLSEKIINTVGDSSNFCVIIDIYNKTKHLPQDTFTGESLEIATQTKFVAETMLDWIKIALCFEMANAQDQPGYKIRHLKCGIRLIEWCCSSSDFVNLLWNQNFDIQGILMDLYKQEYMAVSIKLMILRALDVYLQKKAATEKFLLFGQDGAQKQNGFLDTIPVSDCNGYRLLIELIRKNPSVRVKFAINSILKKLNLFEVLYKLQTTIAKVKIKFSVNEIDLVVKSLDQVLRVMQNGDFVVSQPKRFLPVAAQFEINRSDSRHVVVEYFKMHNLLQCLAFLLTHPNTMNASTVKAPAYEILQELTETKEGLQYLFENADSSNLLVKCLLQHQYEFTPPIEIRSKYLGFSIAYKVQCLYHVEYLFDLGAKLNWDIEANDIIDQLHALYCLTFSNVGKVACCEVLGIDENVNCLLRFFDVLTMKDKPESQMQKLKKSPGVGYIIDLLYNAVVYEANVPFLESYSKRLINILNYQDIFEPNVAAKLCELSPFLKPFENSAPLSYDNIAPYVEIINKNLEVVTSCPGQLVLALRIIHHLGISKYANKSPVLSENPLNNYIELKYKHVILQLFSAEGIATITSILQKICDHYEQPALHTATYTSNHGVQIINVIQPSVELLKQMLTYVIQCRNTSFKDLTAVPVILQTFNLLKAFPTGALAYVRAQKVCKDLLDTLLVYTQPVSEEVHEKDSLNKTLWTLMCGEVIKYATTAPYTFASGLLILSELLPLPLPIQTQEVLAPEEVSWAVNLRKLWSAHLHSHSASIQELINRMCTTTHPPLLNLLRRLCVQLADLAANSAIMIARGILDSVHSCLVPAEDAKLIPCNGHAARLLNFLACLVTHGTIKCAVLQLLHNNHLSSVKGDEKYPTLIPVFVQILKTSSDLNSHVQSQECILSVVQSFCDCEITLLQNTESGNLSVTSEVFLANALPTKALLLIFIKSMVEHLMADNSFVTYLPIIRAFLLLTEHDYGFHFLKDNLVRKTEPLLHILNKLESNFSKDNAECLSTFNTLIEFLRVCSTLDEVEDPLIYKPRSFKMSIKEVQALVGWKVGEDIEADKKHPILALETIIKKTVQEDATFESLLESLTIILTLLNNTSTSLDSKDGIIETLLPVPEPLLTQFAGRLVCSFSEITDERLVSLLPPTDEADNNLDNVSCDLTEICRQSLPQDTNLIREVEKICRICPSNNNEQTDSKEKQMDAQKDKMKRPFITPSRGRGFARTIPQRSDLFRSRPPNTSRPPSLHVDDFVALETCGAQPTGPTGYNKISRELLATTRVARGTRGRAFVASERAVQYRQTPWWGSNLGRGPYQ